jgi:hypothetical protein
MGLAGLLVVLVVPLLPVLSTPGPTVELTASEAAPNEEVGFSGTGFGACLPEQPPVADDPDSSSEGIAVDPVDPPPTTFVTVWWDESVDLGQAPLEPDGSFSTTITVPADARAEPYFVGASCSPGSGAGEISEDTVLVVVPPPTSGPTPTDDPPPTTDPPPTAESSPTAGPAPTPASTAVTGPGPAPATPALPDPTASPAVPSSGPDVALAALATALVLGLGLLGLTRALRKRSRHRPREPRISAVAAPAPPGLLDVHQLGPARTVALRVDLRVDPGVLTHRAKE